MLPSSIIAAVRTGASLLQLRSIWSRRFLIVDEVLAVGDIALQKNALARCRMSPIGGGQFWSHNMGAISTHIWALVGLERSVPRVTSCPCTCLMHLKGGRKAGPLALAGIWTADAILEYQIAGARWDQFAIWGPLKLRSQCTRRRKVRSREHWIKHFRSIWLVRWDLVYRRDFSDWP
jgi:hypothetical protein